MKTDRHLDWLSITIPVSREWRNFIPLSDLTLQGKGRHGYGQAWVDKRTGARIETAATRDDMGTHLTLSGDVLRALRDDLGATDDTIIERIEQWDGRCSRVDLAIDIYAGTLTPHGLNADLLSGVARMPCRTWRFIDGHNNGIHGATVDTGSVKSDRRFRFYDKAAEQRIKDGEAWVRLELQLRRLYARAQIEACAEHGTSAAIASTIGNYLSWSDTEYQSALVGACTYSPVIPRGLSNRQRWLTGQVAKALAQEIHAYPDFRHQFFNAVKFFEEQMTD